MKTLYIECNMGAAGDMLMAALLELLPDRDAFLAKLNGLGIPGVEVVREDAQKCGIMGTHIAVTIHGTEEHSHDVHDHDHPHAHDHEHEHHHHDHAHEHEHEHHREHHHTGLPEIEQIVNALDLSDKVKSDVLAVYGLIAEAESKAHGKPVTAVHFHEVGMMDAVADIVGACMAIEALAADKVLCSPIHVGSGMVKCAHGILPVPAPATAHILRGVPTYGGQIKGELCTPTGAALLKHFADDFCDRPVMATDCIGYGMGKKDFPVANCVRAFIGEQRQKDAGIVKLECNLDDMTGETLAFALETLMDAGALDAYFMPIQMKKGRPGQMLSCLCKPDDEERLSRLILKHTTTFGVRSLDYRRRTLDRKIETIDTPLGAVNQKRGQGYGADKRKFEYEDIAKIAREQDMSLAEVIEKL